MARPKRSSRTLTRAERRIASVQSIDAQFDLGDGVTAKTYDSVIADLRDKLAAYNTALSTLDALYNDVKQAERTLATMSEKVLLGVAYRFGKDSQEYEMAGGVRKSERKRPVRKTPATA